jgi:alpha-1,3-rhamnosyl/mannosyltransferase
MIKVGFGVSVLNRVKTFGGIDGIGTYTAELLNQLSKKDKEVEIKPFYVGSEMFSSGSESKSHVSLGNFKSQVLYSSLTGHAFYGSQKFSEDTDIVHATDHYIPKISNTPLVATLMDAIPLSHPEWASVRYRSIKNHFWVKTASWADKIITISDFSKHQISEHFKISLDRITTIPLGVDQRWFEKVSPDKINQVLLKYSINKNYFISVGTFQPRKNVQRTVDAYLALPEHVKNDSVLVLVGRSGWGCDNLIANIKSGIYGDSVIWLQHIKEDELIAIINGAKALVYPSLFEGFGLPVLEAFAAGVPVITSNTTSLPEVAGDAALLVDPLDVSAISQSMSKVFEDDDLRSEIVRKGTIRASEFSWARTATETIRVYKEVIDTFISRPK